MCPGEPPQVIHLPAGTKIWLAGGVTDMRRGFDGLSEQVQTVLQQQPFSGHVFVFRGRGLSICISGASSEGHLRFALAAAERNATPIVKTPPCACKGDFHQLIDWKRHTRGS